MTILIVCEGNICRSPYVQHVLDAGLRAAGVGDLLVASAGVRTSDGRSMFHRSASALAAAGVDHEDFTSRAVTTDRLRDVDLVLTMERWHRASIVELAPRLLRRTFTLREAARLAARVDPTTDDVADLGAALRRHRLDALPATASDDDVPDPVAADDQAFATFVATADAAVSALLPVLVANAEVTR